MGKKTTVRIEPPATSQILDINEAAALIGVSHFTIRRKIANGTLAAMRLKGSKSIRVRRADVLALLEDQ